MNHKENAAQLHAWLEQHGGYLQEKIEIAYNESEGYHLRALDVIDISRALVHVPRILTLSISTLSFAKSSWPEDFITHYLEKPYVITRFLLMDEFLYHSASWWYPYISLLPQPSKDYHFPPFNTPLWFSAEDARWLQGTGLTKAAKQMDDLWQAEYNGGINFLKQLPNYGRFAWMLYKWAATVLSSRCFPSDKYADKQEPLQSIHEEGPGIVEEPATDTIRHPVLVPVLDLANHNPRVKMKCHIDQKGYSLYLFEKVSIGAQIYITYGAKSNEELLMGYGFVIPDNPTDFLGLSFPILDTPRKRCAQQIITEGRYFPLCISHAQLGIEQASQSEFTLAPDIFHLRMGMVLPTSLLDTIWLNVANERELKELYCEGARSSKRSSTQAHAQLLLALFRRNEHLSTSPAASNVEVSTANQRIARRYASGQLRILRHHLQKILENLRQIRQSPFVWTLESLLQSNSHIVRRGMRKLCRAVCGTRNHVTLKAQGLEDSIMIIFACLLWVMMPRDQMPASDEKKEDLEAHSVFHKWHSFIVSTYCPPPDSSTSQCIGINCFCPSKSFHPWTVSESKNESSMEYAAEVVAAYAIVHRAFSVNDIDPIFAAPDRWTKDFLQWGFGIWMAEAVVLPITPSEDEHYDLDGCRLEDIEIEKALYLECN